MIRCKLSIDENLSQTCIRKEDPLRSLIIDALNNTETILDYMFTRPRSDTDSFNIDSDATFAKVDKNSRPQEQTCQTGITTSFMTKRKAVFTSTQNGADKGFGDGGIIAILKGAPELNNKWMVSLNFEFV